MSDQAVLGGDTDAVIIKYGSGGTTLWRATHPDAAHYPGETDVGIDQVFDVAVGGDNVYAVGKQTVDRGGTTDTDFLTLAIWR